MIVLDTNVLSALMRRDADQTVVTWLDLQPSESVWITAVTGDRLRDPLRSGAARAQPTQTAARGRVQVAPSMRISRDGFSPSTTKRLVRRQVSLQSGGQSGDPSTFVTSRSPASSPREGRHSLPVTLAISRILELRSSTLGHRSKADLNCASPVYRKR
jgi:hypothetical protein